MRIQFNTPVMYETSEVGGGQGAVTTEPQAPAATQPAAQGTQQGQPGTADGSFWGMFPGVPEEHRALLEPHLREHVLPYVTRLEQQQAPFKEFANAGVTPEDAKGLVSFAQQYETAPLDTWLAMGRQLAEDGVIHNGLDLEALNAIARGQEVDEETVEQVGSTSLPDNLPPELHGWAQNLMGTVQQLQQGLDGIQTAEQQRAQEAQQARQSQLLNESKSTILGNLKAAGMPVNETGDPEQPGVTGDDVVAMLIVTKGNAQQAEARLLNLRNGVLKGFTDTETPTGKRNLELPNGAPPARAKSQRRGGSRSDGFDKARAGAEAMLQRQVKSDIQG